MGAGNARTMPRVRDDDWHGLRRALNTLSQLSLGKESTPTFGGLDINGSLDMNDNPILDVGYIDFNLENGIPQAEGRLKWNPDDGTLEVGMPGGSVNLQVGQEMLLRVTNGTGSTIANGTPVYISGASGVNVIVGLADADFATGVGLRTVAVVTEAIDAGLRGYATTEGLVRDVDTSMFAAAGVPVYLAKGGGLATAPPTPPDVTFVIGVVVRKHASEGVLLILQTSLPNLSSLSDVDDVRVDNDVLQWNSATNVWDSTKTLDGLTLNSPIVAGTLEITSGLITSASGEINFDDENISTGGNLEVDGDIISDTFVAADSATSHITFSIGAWSITAGSILMAEFDSGVGGNILFYSDLSVDTNILVGSNLLLASGSITDTSGVIDFDNTDILLGTDLLLSSGSITAPATGAIDFDDDDLVTTGDIDCSGHISAGNNGGVSAINVLRLIEEVDATGSFFAAATKLDWIGDSNNTGTIRGLGGNFQMNAGALGDVNNVALFEAQLSLYLANSATITKVTGFKSQLYTQSAHTGTLGAYCHFEAFDFGLAFGGVINSQYGLYLPSLTRATVNWAIYSLGGNSAHVGNVRIGDTTVPTAQLEVGTGANYTEIDSTGNIKPKGSATIVVQKASGKGIKVDQVAPTFGYRDLLNKIYVRDIGSGTAPSWSTYLGNIKQYLFAANDEAWVEFHVPHDWVPGTDLFIHVHWSHIGTLVTGGSVTWGFDVTHAKGYNQAAFPATVNPTIAGTAHATQRQHEITEIQLSAAAPSATQIDTDDIEVDSLILVRVYLSANNITVSGGAVPDPFMHYCDLHYQSTNMATKDKNTPFYT